MLALVGCVVAEVYRRGLGGLLGLTCIATDTSNDAHALIYEGDSAPRKLHAVVKRLIFDPTCAVPSDPVIARDDCEQQIDKLYDGAP